MSESHCSSGQPSNRTSYQISGLQNVFSASATLDASHHRSTCRDKPYKRRAARLRYTRTEFIHQYFLGRNWAETLLMGVLCADLTCFLNLNGYILPDMQHSSHGYASILTISVIPIDSTLKFASDQALCRHAETVGML
jgi:hypothetical protein